MDVLAIAPRWPPARTPRAIMNERLMRALNWSGDIFVTDESDRESAFQESLGKYRIHRSQNLYSPLLARVLKRLGVNLFQCPDKNALWAMRVSYRAIRDQHAKRPDLLLSISKWDSAHLASLLIHRRFPKLPWISLFSDPWVDMERFGYVHHSRFTRWANVQLESRVVRETDAIVVTNEATRDLFLERYPSCINEKLYIVPQCYDPDLYPSGNTSSTSRNKLVLRYLGDFYGPRSPKPLLKAVLRLEEECSASLDYLRIELIGRMWGTHSADSAYLVKQCRSVETLSEVSYQQSLSLMRTSTILLVIDAPVAMSPFLPSKLIDYLGANRPVWGITPPGAARELIKRTGGWVSDVRYPDEIYHTLKEICTLWQETGSVESFRPNSNIRAEFDKHRVAAHFEEVVQSLIKSRGSL